MDLKGTAQNLFDDKEVRKRRASFPFELPYRLINMFSVKGDTVLDPFLGIGTTTFAAIAACRNSVGYEVEERLRDLIFSKMMSMVSYSNDRINRRIKSHFDFIKERFKEKSGFKHINNHYKFPVITLQEKELLLNELISSKNVDGNLLEVTYSDKPQEQFCIHGEDYFKKQ